MIDITLPDDVSAKLAGQTFVNVLNSAGERIGQMRLRTLKEVVRQSQDRVSDEELARRRMHSKDTAITTEELLAYLRSL